MLTFPESTYFNRRIPKQKFYDSFNISSVLQKLFVQEIDTILWMNKLSPETVNLEPGRNVKEIQIIQIALKQQSITRTIIDIIDREIPYHIVFILKYNDMGMIWINYKEDSLNRKDKYTVNSGCRTDWMPYDNLTLDIKGLDLDKVYENFMIHVSGGKLKIDDADDLKDAVMKVKEKENLNAYITTLENKIANEKQFNRQVELNSELKKVREELDRLTSPPPPARPSPERRGAS